MKTMVFCAVLTTLSLLLNPLIASTKLILYPQIVTSAESDVFTVIVNGEIIMEDGEVKTMDEQDVINEAQKVAERVARDAKKDYFKADSTLVKAVKKGLL